MSEISERCKILLVEDDEVDRMAFERFVRTQHLPYDYVIVPSIVEARKALVTNQFDVALMDYTLGDGKSSELFEAARNVPIIMITGAGDLNIAVELMKAGAYDYLTKDRQGNYLVALPITVKNTIERWQAQQELVRYRSNLEKIVEERTAAWRKGELRLTKLVEATSTIMFSLDTEGNFNYITGNTQEILGYPAPELIGKSGFIFANIGSNEQAQASFQAILAGQTITADIEINGHWVSVSASPTWEDKAVTGVIGVLHDIGERKKAELKVQRERNLLRTLIDNIPDYIFIKDRDGRFVETNSAHAAGANLSREGLVGKLAREVFDPTIADQFHVDDAYVLKSGQSIINEERITTAADGSERWVLTTKVPLFNELHTEIVGLVGISRDITDRRNAEELRLQAEHERMELEREREVIELKQHFIATASHDFRTPLSIILMTANTLESYSERLSPEKRLEKLKQIEAQVNHMIKLLDDVLTVSKASAGKIAILPQRIDLKPFCERIWEDIVRLDKGQHQVHFEFFPTVQHIQADEHLLHQILINLLSNAFKYTPRDGHVHFKISGDEQFVTFTIMDTGYGIPDSEQRRLFEPFFRATNVKKVQGTGLGLAIVKSYVDLHQGTITVQSQENHGTLFAVKLPIAE